MCGSQRCRICFLFIFEALREAHTHTFINLLLRLDGTILQRFFFLFILIGFLPLRHTLKLQRIYKL